MPHSINHSDACLAKFNRDRGIPCVFVTTNRLFSTAARQFLIDEKVLQPNHCPPVLQVGQVTTIAWLMREHKIDPKKAGRELLANCYAAIKPDAEWFQNFRTAIEKIVGNVEEYASIPENKIKLQAARRIAQDQTFGNSALIKSLNAAELLHLADKAAEEEKLKIRAEASEEALALVEDARQSARSEANIERQKVDERRARQFATNLRKLSIVPAIILFVIFAALYDKSALFNGKSYLVS